MKKKEKEKLEARIAFTIITKLSWRKEIKRKIRFIYKGKKKTQMNKLVIKQKPPLEGNDKMNRNFFRLKKTIQIPRWLISE